MKTHAGHYSSKSSAEAYATVLQGSFKNGEKAVVEPVTNWDVWVYRPDEKEKE